MSFIPTQDAICCQRCGLCGFTKRNCPQCNTCVYCKEEGHIVTNCEKAPPCGKCGKKDHPERRCSSNRVSRLPPRLKIGGSNQKKKKKKRNARGSPNRISKSPARMSISRWCPQDRTKIVNLQFPKRFEMSVTQYHTQ